jgi:class III poly(R)-hydroxyalkanoic acid synthase PhaE subunit
MKNEFLGAMQSGAEQYLKGLNELSEKFMGANASSSKGPSWSEGMEQFAKLYGGTNNAHEGVFDQIMTQGKGFVSMLEKMYQSASLGNQTGSGIDFAALGQQMLAELAKNNPFSNLPGVQIPGMNFSGLPGMASFGNASSFGATPNFAMPNFPGFSGGGFDPKTFSAENFLNMPAFGSNRESQERKQALIKHIASYMQAMQAYQGLQMKSIQMAIERMQSKLEERNEHGRQLDSLKAVYDLWIDALEESFAEVALTKDYQTAYGQLVDAQMRVRANVQKQIELATGEIGMPTRSELEGVHQKLAETRRTLRMELSELKAEIAELKASRAAKSVSVKSEGSPAGGKAIQVSPAGGKAIQVSPEGDTEKKVSPKEQAVKATPIKAAVVKAEVVKAETATPALAAPKVLKASSSNLLSAAKALAVKKTVAKSTAPKSTTPSRKK